VRTGFPFRQVSYILTAPLRESSSLLCLRYVTPLLPQKDTSQKSYRIRFFRFPPRISCSFFLLPSYYKTSAAVQAVHVLNNSSSDADLSFGSFCFRRVPALPHTGPVFFFLFDPSSLGYPWVSVRPVMVRRAAGLMIFRFESFPRPPTLYSLLYSPSVKEG